MSGQSLLLRESEPAVGRPHGKDDGPRAEDFTGPRLGSFDWAVQVEVDASSTTMRAPKRSACPRIASISSGP